MPAHYSFGEKAHALIGVLLNSEGRISLLARKRDDGSAPMSPIFESNPVYLSERNVPDVEFTFTVSDQKAGLFTAGLENWPDDWSQLTSLLGYAHPFGLDEIDPPGLRPLDVQINRVVKCRFSADGKVSMRDANETMTTTTDLAKRDHPGRPGEIYLTVRVTEENSKDAVSLTFPENFGFDATPDSPERFQNKMEFSL